MVAARFGGNRNRLIDRAGLNDLRMKEKIGVSPHLALLRGINVGGKHSLPMKDLAEIFTTAGCTNVRTYIQSGNVIFCAASGILEELPGRIVNQIAKRFGYQAPVILRTAKQLGDIIRNNPFQQAGAAESTLHVLFLADLPDPTSVKNLDPDRSRPDAFFVHNREVYLHMPNGMGRTKLTNAYFDSTLATTSTARNWRTVLKLFELMQD